MISIYTIRFWLLTLYATASVLVSAQSSLESGVGLDQISSSPVIDDHALRAQLHQSLMEVAERDDHVTGENLSEQLEAVQGAPLNIEPLRAGSGSRMNYDSHANGVVIVSSVYKCGKCDKWHLGNQATGWILSSDGLMVTNHHVFQGSTSAAYGILTLDGQFAEVVKVESSDKRSDLAVFRVEGDGFQPLPVASAVSVGERVHVISHPDTRYFSYTSGNVSRIFKGHSHNQRPTATMLAITADFAKGSSGGPVMNDQGEVVGMVASTHTIYYHGDNPRRDSDGNLDKGPSQMVIKQCVSLHEIRALLGKPETRVASLGKSILKAAQPQVVPGVKMWTPPAEPQQLQEEQNDPVTIPATPLIKIQPRPAAEPKGPGPESLIGKPLPAFKLPTIDGSELSNESARGKVLLIDFWASWCGPCMAASPILQKLHEEYSEQGLMVIGANTSERNSQGESDRSAKIAKSYAKKNGYNYTFTYGSDDLKDACGVTGLPTMLIVDKEGTVREVVVGFNQNLLENLSGKITPLL